MGQLRQVKQIEKIVFPIVVTILVTLFLPDFITANRNVNAW